MVISKAAQSKKTVASASTVRTNQNLEVLAERNSAVSSVNVSKNHHMPFILLFHIQSGTQLAKRATIDDTTTLESALQASASTCTKMSAHTFAVGLLHGTIQASPGVNIPAVPLPVLQAMAQTDIWPPNFSDFLC